MSDALAEVIDGRLEMIRVYGCAASTISQDHEFGEIVVDGMIVAINGPEKCYDGVVTVLRVGAITKTDGQSISI
jgi:hypothetical protein